MQQIIFNDSPEETFNIMAYDDRFMVCSRIYTIAEAKIECDIWDTKLEDYLKDCWNDLEDKSKFENFDDWRYEKDCGFKHQQIFTYQIESERPCEPDEDTQCYTLVDKEKNIRGADNFYNKFNYLDESECRKALKELKTPNGMNGYELEISRRNRIDAGDYKII